MAPRLHGWYHEMANNLALPSILIAFTIALSGCFADDQGDAKDASPSPTTSTGQGGNGTSENQTEQPPIVSLSVLRNGTEVQAVNGSYALIVNETVTFDASDSTDPDGDAVKFSWVLDDEALTTDPAFEYTFADVGNYSLQVTVVDESGMSSNATISLALAASGPAPGTVLREEKKAFSGTITAAVQTPLNEACATYGSGATFNHDWTITASEPDGTMTKVSHFVIKLTGQANVNRDTDVYFYDPSGKEVGKGTGATAAETIDVTGDFEPGKYVIKVVGCTAVNATYSVDATATYVVA